MGRVSYIRLKVIHASSHVFAQRTESFEMLQNRTHIFPPWAYWRRASPTPKLPSRS